jgi:hypothetical protein
MEVPGKGKKFMRRFRSKDKQEIIVAVDYINARQRPYGCSIPKVFYNIYIVKDNKLVTKPKAVNKQISHGMISFDAEKDQ